MKSKVSHAMQDVLASMSCRVEMTGDLTVDCNIYPNKTVLALSRRNLISYDRSTYGYALTAQGWALLGKQPPSLRCGAHSLRMSTRCRLEPNHAGVHIGPNPTDPMSSVWWA